jgi:hypothetical protein
MRYVALLSVGLLTFVPHGAGVAQQPRIPIHRGQLVRLTAPDLGFNRQTAVFRMLRNDTLVVAVRDSAVHCPVASVTGLDVSRGQRSWAGVGALFGAVGGAGLGVVLGVGVLAPLCEEDRGTCTGATVGGGSARASPHDSGTPPRRSGSRPLCEILNAAPARDIPTRCPSITGAPKSRH